MLLVVGTFDMARAYLTQIVVANSVREVSRYAAAHANDARSPNYLADATQAGFNLAIGLDPSKLTLNPTAVPSTGVAQSISVTGAYEFHSLTPVLRVWWGDPIYISSNTATPVG